MLSYITLAVVGLVIAYAINTYRCFAANLADAKQSGIPYFCQYHHNASPARSNALISH